MNRRLFLAVALALALTLSGSAALAQTRPTPTPTPGPLQEPEPVTTTEEVEPSATTAEPAPGIELTVYNQNLGLIKEVRTLNLLAGSNEVRFTDVPSAIDATSVHFQSLTAPGDTVVLEQNYEYDIVGSRKLLSKYVDREITVTTTQGDTYAGTLLSAADDIILATEDGIKIVRTEQVLEYSFPTLPQGLITRPTLVWLLQAAEAGPQDVRVTYLTGGLNWQADYVALLSDDDAALSLTGWITLENQSGASYENAKLKLVAGDINRVKEAEQMLYMADGMRAMATPTPQVEERAFFEYHLYEVQRPVTVKDQQTKQIEFASAPKVTAEKVFILPGGGYPWWGSVYSDPGYPESGALKVQVRLRFVNDEQSGLGIPLPKGRVRVYKEDVDGGAEFAGEDAIDHTPRNEKLSLYLGDAFDVVGERVQIDFRQIDKREIEETVQVTVRNHKDEDIQVRVIENLFRAQDATVTEASEGYTQLDANTIEFVLNVPADGEAQVTYTVDYRW